MNKRREWQLTRCFFIPHLLYLYYVVVIIIVIVPQVEYLKIKKEYCGQHFANSQIIL